MKKKRKPRVRSAVTGKYVLFLEAAKNPNTTVMEWRKAEVMPEGLHKYILIVACGSKKKYWYIFSDKDLSLKLDLAERGKWKPVGIFRCFYEKVAINLKATKEKP